MEKDKPIVFDSDDRDQVLLKLIEQDRITHANSHLGDLSVKQRPYKYRSEIESPRGYTYYSEFHTFNVDRDAISLVMAPAWGVIFPPYNLARLSAVLRKHGYSVNVYDCNIECYHNLKESISVDYWDGSAYYAWLYPNFETLILPYIKSTLNLTVDKILNAGNDIVGFSLYNTNLMASLYMIRRLKEIRPEIVIVVGGPEAFSDDLENFLATLHLPATLIDYRIKGEGEHELVLLLEYFRKVEKSTSMKTLGNLSSKLNLNDLPFPDYSDYNITRYLHPDGVSIETSRGCIAQCSFCSETWFWKYRWRTSERVIEEMQHQIDTYRITRFWFVDSLANGNLKEFKKLVELIIEKKLNIRWNSYARCDGRMDLELFKKINDSGCMTLSFGVESGSQAVLDAMKKKIKVHEIEDNLRDGFTAGLKNHVNWIVGFPNEGPAEFLHSLHVLYNCRNWIYVISPGFTCGDAQFADMNVNWKDYDMAWVNKPSDNMFLGSWYTTNYKNTILHRFIRLKFMQIWLKLAVDYGNGTVINAQHRPTLENLYKVELLDDTFVAVDYIQQQQSQSFNYFTGSTSQEQLSASIANEFLPYAWIIFNTYGAFKLEMKYDYDKDLVEFNNTIVRRYWADVTMGVNKDGILTFNIDHRFEHGETDDYIHIKDTHVVPVDMSFSGKHSLTCHVSDFNGS